MTTAPSSFWQIMWHTRLRDVLRGRIDGRLNWQRVVAEAALPTDVADVIVQVVRRTRLWRIEKADVAQELVAHFQDGVAAGRNPKQLVDSFGDPQQAARLIRRAKKRGRPLAWHAWRWAFWSVFWSVAGLMLLYVATVIYFVVGRPSIQTDYLAVVNERALAVPEEERAWPLYREAIAKMDLIHPPPWINEAGDLRPTDKAWPNVVEWLRDHVDALAVLRQASVRPELGFPVWSMDQSFSPEDRRVLPELGRNLDESKLGPPTFEPLSDRWLMGTRLPHLPPMRVSARILALDARKAAMDGDNVTSYEDIAAILKMSHHFEEQPFLVNGLVALAVQRLAYGTVQRVLAEHAAILSDDQLRDLAHAMAAGEVDWHRAYDGERFSFCDVVQRLYTDDGHGDGRITDEGLRAFTAFGNQPDIDKSTGLKDWRMQFGDLAIDAVAPASLYIMASRGEIVAMYERFIGQQEATLDQPLWEIEPNAMEQELEGWSTIERTRYLPITLLFPALSSIRLTIEAGRGMRDGVLVGIALELYHREHVAWPKTLDELATKYLPSVPVDRFNGKQLHYKIVDDRPLVYSVGADGDDDSGRVPLYDEGKPDGELASPKSLKSMPKVSPPDGDWVIWSTTAAGDL